MLYVIKNEHAKYWSMFKMDWVNLDKATLFDEKQKSDWILPDDNKLVPLICKNHYGIHVCSETSITGVVQNNNVEFLSDAMYYEDGIDLDFEKHLAECPNEEHDLCWESTGSDWIIGDWEKDADGLWEPNKDGERGYSAIVREIYTQVVWSKHTQRCQLCSPCYPGQGNLGNPGDFLTFDLPKEMYGEKNDD